LRVEALVALWHPVGVWSARGQSRFIFGAFPFLLRFRWGTVSSVNSSLAAAAMGGNQCLAFFLSDSSTKMDCVKELSNIGIAQIQEYLAECKQGFETSQLYSAARDEKFTDE
jgi:hypothetical protein